MDINLNFVSNKKIKKDDLLTILKTILDEHNYVLEQKGDFLKISKITIMEENFFERVYFIVRQIPYGRVTSYGAIAKALGTARSARMVGWAMNASHHLEDVPAHRVVNRKGLLSGKHHFSGTNLMQQLLENEGIEIINNQIIGFEKVFWEPEISN